MVDQILGFTKTLVWPDVVIWLVLLFRKELRLLLDRVSQFKWGEFEARFSKAVRESAGPANAVALVALDDAAVVEEFEPVFGLAKISPRAAVLESWTLLERDIQDTVQFAGITTKSFNISLIIQQLSNWGKVPPEIIKNMKTLRDLRNAAAHVPDVAINPQMAIEYIQLTQAVIKALKAVRTNA